MVTYMKRIGVLVLLMIATAAISPVMAASAIPATLYKNPSCQCCENYAKYLDKNGFAVKVIATDDLARIKREHHIPPALEGCHTVLVSGYVVDGHVPVEVVKRLLRERSAITGIALPGMPAGSPGMMGKKQGPFVVYAFGNGQPAVYATE